MIKPLINRDALADAMLDVGTLGSEYWFNLADAAIDYLRAVITPAALNPPGDVPVFVQIGDDWVKIEDLLHRRIFGGRTDD